MGSIELGLKIITNWTVQIATCFLQGTGTNDWAKLLRPSRICSGGIFPLWLAQKRVLLRLSRYESCWMEKVLRRTRLLAVKIY